MKLWLAVAAFACLPAVAQQAQPPIYAMIAEFAYPREKWQDVDFVFEKQYKPVLAKHLASGGIIEWARGIPLVHTADGYTHIMWFSAPTLAGLNRVLDDIAKLPGAPFAAATKHRDQLMRSVVYQVPKPRTGGPAYMSVSYTQLIPGRNQQWRELWDKETAPTYQKLLSDGGILGYGIDQEFIHTEAPSARWVWSISADMEGIDKMNTAFDSQFQSRTPEQRRAFGDAMRENQVAGAHRDGLYRLTEYVHK